MLLGILIMMPHYDWGSSLRRPLWRCNINVTGGQRSQQLFVVADWESGMPALPATRMGR